MERAVVNRMTGITSVLHLLVDGLCVCCLYLMVSSFPTVRFLGVFLTYNVLAFLSQPLTGMLADRIERKHWLLFASILLLTMAVLTTSLVVSIGTATGMLIVSVLLGIGNSLFHVWGGKQVAIITGNDMRALGVFVATGAFGLSVGLVFFSWPLLYVFLLLICLLSGLYVQTDMVVGVSSDRPDMINRRFSAFFVCLSVAVLMAAVMLRSFVGEAFSSGIMKSNTIVLLLGLFSMLGKMSGGWIARKFGIIPALSSMIVATIVCYLCKDYGMAVFLMGLFTVSCTMPITLYLINVVLPEREGLAFGLLAAALIPGYLLAMI
ncbi:MAG: hypothetical protein IJ159_03090 [Prevotella sp.]|nr:hypothetical protein [Prevotella sp.]